MIAGAATLGAMSKSPNAKRVGGPLSWEELSRPDADQNQRFLADGESRRRTSLGITRAGLAKRCVTWLKLLLTPAPNATAAAPMREFVDALGLFPALFDSEPSARSRRARLTWLLTHDRRLDASTREAATALIEACEHLGVLLWPDAETA
jgi:hypothetical protein